MSVSTLSPRPAAPADRSTPGPLRRTALDAATSATRVLLYYRHSPALLAVSLAVPVVMVVLFGYVFGSAMQVPGSGDYREFLMPGLFAMVAINGITPTMVGVARDVERGATDRLRSMPVSRFGVLLGSALADLVIGVAVLVPLVGVGLAVGWRMRNGLADALAAFALLVLFRFVMTWLGTFLGLAAGSEQMAGQLAVLTFPPAIVTNVFVPTGGMPGWLRVIADWNPASAVVAACRQLFGNPSAPASAWPLQHPVVATLLWSAVLLAVFAPLAARKYSTHGR
ncbi:ABC-2 type transport system permease protein [Kitasatospora sp. MAA4]|uniref:ABC transporter permease n=1 Tax=Kitasatospora sp. MAA4 TaxID=3035093 RepID=UPI002473FC6B|nr:ABC transporter permease [Kitasatospora sp. MAA4]MDH6131197.1 ABC-2 type transport system permease protein [Kitasatospora sp. MAA4]